MRTSYSQSTKEGSTGAAANAAGGVVIQPKLSVGAVDDPLEHEADAMADKAMSMQPVPQVTVGDSNTINRKCAHCEEEKVQRKPLASFIQKKGSDGGTVASDPVSDQINATRGNGNTMDVSTRSFMESRFGADFSNVKIHTNNEAIQMNRELNAKAFTVGSDIYFNEGEYQPGSTGGRHLLAHELTHTMQQENGVQKKIQRLSAANCSKDCAKSDGVTSTKKAKLIVNTDKESDFLTIPLHKDSNGKSWPVGHSWVKLINSAGEYWTYGFWPEKGFSGAHPFDDVKGCVHHPDTAHTASSSQEFELTDAEFDMAKQTAIDLCLKKPDYNLYSNQCTTFVKDILASVGKAPIGGFNLIWDSPNALSAWMNGSRKSVGIGYDFATSSFPAQTSGTSLQGSYVYQFYSLLGNKIRLQWLTQGQIGLTSQTSTYVGTGLQMEIKPQKLVYIPDIYVYGTTNAGLLSPLNPTQKWGVGFAAGVGASYNIQNSLYLGFEYSVIKNLVQNDPVLQSLSLKLGLLFQ